MNAKIDHNIANFNKLSDSHKQLLPARQKYFEDQKMAVFQNQEIIKLILEDCEANFGFEITGSTIKVSNSSSARINLLHPGFSRRVSTSES